MQTRDSASVADAYLKNQQTLDILLRMLQLARRSASEGDEAEADRAALDEEFQMLKDEIDAIELAWRPAGRRQ